MAEGKRYLWAPWGQGHIARPGSETTALCGHKPAGVATGPTRPPTARLCKRCQKSEALHAS